MVIQEQPRLTGFLRTIANGSPLNLQEIQLDALKQLKRKREVKVKRAKSDEHLQWSYFNSACEADPNNTKNMRGIYNDFLKVILQIIGDESSSSELHSAAYIVYHILAHPKYNDSKKREKLAASFGMSIMSLYPQLIEKVDALDRWRVTYLSNREKAEITRQEAEEQKKRQHKTRSEIYREEEYGFDFSERFPAPQLFDSRVVEGARPTPAARKIETASSESYYSMDSSRKLSYWEEAALQPVNNHNWLQEQCEVYLAESNNPLFTPNELSVNLVPLLQKNSSDVALQNVLFEFLGDSSFEFIQLLLTKRNEYLSVYNSKQNPDGSSLRNPAANLVGISIQNESDKMLDKLLRKEEKRKKKHGKQEEFQPTVDANTLREQREASLRAGPPDLSTLAPAGTKSDQFAFGQGIMLPEGSVRTHTKKYEQVFVPYAKQAPFAADEKLVQIDAFDEFVRPAFNGYKSLNRLQSKLFDAAYHSNENLLVCAPTGAGKTDVAMMTVLHEVKQHENYGRLRKEEFKIVYVAPMKALAAEVTQKFSKRLSALGIVCKELTGDMQLTRKELTETQIIVTTPEKWDVITRKSGDVALTSLVRLLIIDEVHLLHEERGPVIEVLVARTLRQVESSQSMIRIVGLSATLPNYKDIAAFLRVNPHTGLFHFDATYRPVPLDQQFIGVKQANSLKQKLDMNEICYEKVVESVLAGNQVMVFVHSRKDTAKTAEALIAMAKEKSQESVFVPQTSTFEYAKREVSKSRNKEVKNLFPFGFGTHHAGMLRSDRNLVEKYFFQGDMKVLCCTATLAWGVNLPAHTVIIKGTQIYDSKAGNFVELGMLDVMQIFGRAGRPQFDTSGEGIIITSHDQLPRYLALLNTQLPIESQLNKALPDHLNAEIVLGTVTNVREAMTWLSYTYLAVRMGRNPLVYGVTYDEKEIDPTLANHRRGLITSAARILDRCQMLNFDERSGNFSPTDLGRVASHFYIHHESVTNFNEKMVLSMSEPDLVNMASQAKEFENIMLREEELQELDRLKAETCPLPVRGGVENRHGKAYLSHASIDGFALVSDSAYVVQNISRLFRGLFEMTMKKGWALVSLRLLTLCKMIDRRLWGFQHPLRQFPGVSGEILHKLEQKNADMDTLLDMEPSEIGAMINHPKLGAQVSRLVSQFPRLDIRTTVAPLTRTVLRVDLEVVPDYEWSDRIHGTVDPWYIWVEDGENEVIYHSEYFLVNKKMVGEVHKLSFTIPIAEPLPPQYWVHAVSDRWLGAETIEPLPLLITLPTLQPQHTELLDLEPLPLAALKNPEYEKLYNFSHFNPIQTQIFHTLYHTNNNLLLGAPTGSGKTITAEIAMFKLFRDTPHLKVVYIGPLKALVRERLNDWSVRFGKKLGKSVVELTGDYTPNVQALKNADIVLTTPEKWDGISRNWQHRSYVKSVGLVVIDEIHLLGEDRGPILEVIVSRMRYIASTTENNIRLVGLSTALANATDLAFWLGIDKVGLYNFRPSVRPVPLEAHIQGYPGKHYCPRMATMNKPAYAAITTHSPEKPVLIFVSSRRQTRLTAVDLIAFAASEEKPRQWLHMEESELNVIMSKITDANLRHTLPFGIALHHAGLPDDDKKIVEELFEKVKIQILISTSTLAWGVNLPAFLVIIKGTEYFDPNNKRYVDFPITDVLQMMGRAGRPQYDHEGGKAVILVHEPKKNFYKKFLYEPFPVESNLSHVLHDHINAEIVSGTITSKQDAVEWLTWTYFFRRLLQNPSYYGLEDTSTEAMNRFLSDMIDKTIEDLEKGKCISVEDDAITPLTMGRITSFYYLHYTTAQLFATKIDKDCDLKKTMKTLTEASEYRELPVRHNEDKLNEELSRDLPWEVDMRMMDSPHVKAHLLLQAHFSRLENLPISDYVTDTKSVLDQAAMVDVAADGGWMNTSLQCMYLLQMIMQGMWQTDSQLLSLPLNQQARDLLNDHDVIGLDQARLRKILHQVLPEDRIREVIDVVSILPRVELRVQMKNEALGGTEMTVRVEMNRISRNPTRGVHCPRFPKMKDEGWWIVLGDSDTGELLALRRLTFNTKKSSTSLSFRTPDVGGEKKVKLLFVSDSYIGLDQEMELKYKVQAQTKKREEEEEKLFWS
ncbi:activating signal cointegrator 1 complex subunit 3 [Planoprotostelium fungivorum]|uniref:Activating signal cointegrator 1 complex subunit 3 n=1 Tax=Planoprotostelium fungivorum TaxID=1890364 RepID=A0A2P6N4F9_9EUKA|nr:activating signal cointegrator 1 complex subunit 3 [Planoprotostelium fungivorum]